MKKFEISEKPYVDLITELHRSFDYFNKVFAQGKLPRPIITVASAGRKKALGWFGPEHWKQGDEKMHEINISAEHLTQGTDEILHTLLHEMAHLKNRHEGKRDVAGYQRHNGLFKKAASEFGLTAAAMGHYGFANTGLTDKSIIAIKSLKPRESVYSLTRNLIFKPKKEGSDTESKNTTVLIDKSLKEDIDAVKEQLGVSQKDTMTVAVKLLKDVLDGKYAVIDAKSKKAIDVTKQYQIN